MSRLSKPRIPSYRQATNPVEVLPPVEANRKPALVAVQVTTRSPLGAIIYDTGGILVDHG